MDLFKQSILSRMRGGFPQRAQTQCPSCFYAPPPKERWSCACGFSWNTFTSNGICPRCSKKWETTSCSSCKVSSPHKDWYKQNATKEKEKVTAESCFPYYAKALRDYEWEDIAHIESLLVSFPSYSFTQASSNPALGTSRLGGCPDVPKDFKWPEHEEEPYCFFAQINLAELPDTSFRKHLPEKGLLYFFLHVSERFDDMLSSPENVAVFFSEETSLHRRPFPDSLIEKFRFYALEFEYTVKWCFPNPPPYVPEHPKYSHKECENMHEFNDLVLGGQNCELLLPTEAVSLDSAHRSLVDYFKKQDRERDSTTNEEKARERKKMISLLHFSLDNLLVGFNIFGSTNAIFSIHEDDLLSQNFSEVVLFIDYT